MNGNKTLRVLVTAGGTREEIDTVRSITNHATGRLGSLIADAFAGKGAQVTYLCSETAAQPSVPVHQVKVIQNVSQLSQTLDELLQEQTFDCVVHSMAVSDFTPQGITSISEIAHAVGEALAGQTLDKEEITRRVEQVIQQECKPPADKKISSGGADTMLLLGQTPKVIAGIKEHQPQTLLVGFKLLSGANEEQLVQASSDLIQKNHCDLVLGNDLSEITRLSHKAFLMDESGIIGRATTKHEIANMITDCVYQKLEC